MNEKALRGLTKGSYFDVTKSVYLILGWKCGRLLIQLECEYQMFILLNKSKAKTSVLNYSFCIGSLDSKSDRWLCIATPFNAFLFSFLFRFWGYKNFLPYKDKYGIKCNHDVYIPKRSQMKLALAE